MTNIMTKEELYLKTIFCCVACDGEIATEEVDLIKSLCDKEGIFKGIESEKHLNNWIADINRDGGTFLHNYLNEVKAIELNEHEQLQLLSLALQAIEADSHIAYSEVKFFKKIRSRLSVSDEAILQEHPDKEDFLLPDINVDDLPDWNMGTQFGDIFISDLKPED